MIRRPPRRRPRPQAVANWFLLLCCMAAGAGVFTGNRAAVPLLCGVFFSLAVGQFEMPLHWWQLGLVDLAILACFVRRNMTLGNMIIACLFPVAWIGYFLPPPFYYNTPYAIVCAQLLLCIPLPWLQRGVWKVSHGPLKRLDYARG